MTQEYNCYADTLLKKKKKQNYDTLGENIVHLINE